MGETIPKALDRRLGGACETMRHSRRWLGSPHHRYRPHETYLYKVSNNGTIQGIDNESRDYARQICMSPSPAPIAGRHGLPVHAVDPELG